MRWILVEKQGCGMSTVEIYWLRQILIAQIAENELSDA